MEEEIWKDIPNYEGYYQASNLGRIKSLLFQNNVWNKKYKREKILKPKRDKANIYRVELWKNGKHKTISVHRLVATTFLENLIDTDMTVNHKDGNRLNNNINNLEWVTRKENIQHAFENNLIRTQKNCILFNKNKKFEFKSLSKASQFLDRNNGYIHNCIKHNRQIKSKDNEIFKIKNI